MSEPADTRPGPLFRWPVRGRVDRTIAKERLYAEGGASGQLKQRFVEDVQRIRWAYKIGEESVRLRLSESLPEFQVVEVELKGVDLPDQVLKAVDGAIPSPIVFELTRHRAGDAEVQVAAARKAPGQRGPRLSSYFRSAWLPVSTPRADLPPALDLEGLYETVLTSLLPLGARPDEELSEAIDRMARVARLEREIGALERRIRNEPQLNRKIDLRRTLKTKQAELEQRR